VLGSVPGSGLLFERATSGGLFLLADPNPAAGGRNGVGPFFPRPPAGAFLATAALQKRGLLAVVRCAPALRVRPPADGGTEGLP
jgi:hypothetical protein